MATTEAEAMQDHAEHSSGHPVDLACTTCAECWTVHVRDGEDVTDKQAECPVAGCDGWGEEV